ncbi:MAG TPA: hypothetical protein VF705_09095 [Longimicrobium sp.]|jgi:hypothetical protein
MQIPDDPFEPERVRRVLTECGLFLAAWEMLKLSIVDKLKGFYSWNYNDGKFIAGPEYHQKVVSLHKHIIDASLEWLVSAGALDRSDIDVVQTIRTHRNDIAHDLPTYALSWGKGVDQSLLLEARRLVHKVDNFWARIEWEGDPEVPEDSDFETATSLKAVLLDHMIAVSAQPQLFEGERPDVKDQGR